MEESPNNNEVREGLYYTKEHEWARVDGERVYVGITDYAQKQLKDIVFIELPMVGAAVKAGGPLCVVESVKATSDVFSPVGGEVVDANSGLDGNAQLINEDPYGKGWIAAVKLSDPSELKKLMSAAEYTKFVKESSKH